MNKILIAISIISIMFLATGCGIYGTGKITGYPTTIEQAFFWDKVYIKSTLESSKEDCFLIDKVVQDINSQDIRTKVNSMVINQTKGTFEYQRHLFTMSTDCYNDEIIDIK